MQGTVRCLSHIALLSTVTVGRSENLGAISNTRSFDRSGFASNSALPPPPSGSTGSACSTYVVLPAARAEKAQGGEQKFLSRAYPFTIKVANFHRFSL